MMKKHKISVIMSVFNGEKYLREAIDSILNQTFSDFEFIIIDDASTDSTREIIQSYAAVDDRIIFSSNNKNHGSEGFIKNLNLGLTKAKGEFIARMDADDISDHTRFQKQLDFLLDNEEIFMVGSSLQLIDGNGTHTGIMSAFPKNEDIQTTMIKNISMFHPVIFFRNNGHLFYREKMQYCEDYDLYFRLMSDGYKFANLPENLLEYRILEDSISRKGSKLIRWLFVEKARSFFLERQKKGQDSYDKFDPEKLLNILNSDYKNSAEELLFALKTAVKYHGYDEAKLILNKSKKHFPLDTTFNKYRFLLKLPSPILPYFTKFLMKLNGYFN